MCRINYFFYVFILSINVIPSTALVAHYSKKNYTWSLFLRNAELNERDTTKVSVIEAQRVKGAHNNPTV